MAEGTRRLAAIMFTDMVGYTSLGQRNESLSLALVEEQRKLIRPILHRHDGREVKTIGDAFFVEFASALEAVRCAYDIQRATREYNYSLPEGRRIHLRVGVHVGDVVESGGDISGDAVNVASRIEPLAEDGGVCLTRQVYDQVQNKFELSMESFGMKSLKNVSLPIEVYRVKMPWEETLEGHRETHFDKHRLAVLPFVSMSPDPNDEYFADGLTEELIGKLSQVSGLEVIARTSVMSFKKKEKKVSEIGKELNVGTVIEGSVRKSGNRIRVTVQVVDTNTEGHLFSSNYDSTMDDIFAVQSDVATKVSDSIPGTILKTQATSSPEKETEDTFAYSYFLKATQLVKTEEEEGPLMQALGLFEQALSRDPNFARAYSGIAKCYNELGTGGYVEWQKAIDKGREAAMKALRINPNLAEAHSRLAEIMFMADDPVEQIEAEIRKALELNPNLAEAYRGLANISGLIGKIAEMVGAYEEAYRLDPLAPDVIRGLGRAYLFAGREEDMVNHSKKTMNIEPYGTCRYMFDYYASKGDLEHAEDAVRQMEKISPTLEYTLLNRGLLAAMTGDEKTAREMIDRLDSAHAPGWSRSSSAGYIYLALGDLAKFYEYTFRATDDHTLQLSNLRFNPLIAKARKDPRYLEVLRRVGVPSPTP